MLWVEERWWLPDGWVDGIVQYLCGNSAIRAGWAHTTQWLAAGQIPVHDGNPPITASRLISSPVRNDPQAVWSRITIF